MIVHHVLCEVEACRAKLKLNLPQVRVTFEVGSDCPRTTAKKLSRSTMPAAACAECPLDLLGGEVR